MGKMGVDEVDGLCILEKEHYELRQLSLFFRF